MYCEFSGFHFFCFLCVNLYCYDTAVMLRLPDDRCTNGEDSLSIEDFVAKLGVHLAELDTDLEKVFRDADTNKNGGVVHKLNAVYP
jgi:hypothetical protein